MADKTRYRPIEMLGPKGWRRMADEGSAQPVADAVQRAIENELA
jgi:hypothetical protein